MKKKAILILLIIACGIILSNNFKVNFNRSNLQEFMLTNIEALAAGDQGEVLISCYKTISEEGPLALTERPYCLTCTSLPGRLFKDDSGCRKKY